MAIRQYDFNVGVTTSSAPTPSTPTDDNHTVTKGYSDDTYAQRSSWYDKVASNAALKAVASADRSNGQVAFNYGTNAFYRFDSASALSDDGDLVLAPDSGTGRWLKVSSGSTGGSGNSIIQELDVQVSTTLAGEALADRDAVCKEVHNGSGSDESKYFKCDADIGNRRSFAGFTRSAVTATANIKTYTISAAYVSGNVVPITINGRGYQTTYASSSDATLQALATLIATDQDVASATVTVVGGNQTGTDDRVITITSRGSLKLNITGTTVTSGASQPTVTIAQTQAAVQNAVDLHQFGPLNGFSGLTPNVQYYLSGTAGAITTTPTANQEVYVGYAESSTVLFVDPFGVTKLWGTPQVFVRSHGSSSGADGGGVQDVDHWNGGSWSAGTASTIGARSNASSSDNSYNGYHHVIDGITTGGSVSATFQTYNKATWANPSNRGTARANSGSASFNSVLTSNHGSTTGAAGGVTLIYDKWNGASWSTGTNWTTAYYAMLYFVQGSLLRAIGGVNSAGTVQSVHVTRNTSDTESSATVLPVSSPGTGASSPSSKGMANATTAGANATEMYEWNGSSWSSVITAAYSQFPSQGNSAYYSNRSVFFQNGGQTASTSGTVNTSQQYNGVSFASATASTNSRGRAVASAI